MASSVVPVPGFWRPHYGILHGLLETHWDLAYANDAAQVQGVLCGARNYEAKASTSPHCRDDQCLPSPEHDRDVVGFVETGRMEPNGRHFVGLFYQRNVELARLGGIWLKYEG
jgi:hypothetical protein